MKLLLRALMVLFMLPFPVAHAVVLSNDVIAERMEDARQAMIEAQYDRAIQTYRELIELPEHAYFRDALELLGLAYERKGDFIRARQAYDRYIQLYPKGGDGTERVKQRLAGLVTADWDEPEKLKEVKAKKKHDAWRYYGSFSQYLSRDVSQYDDQPDVVNQYSLTSYLDTTARYRSDHLDIKSRVSASRLNDLQGDDSNQNKLSYLYVDVNHRQQGWSGRFGRQNPDGGGVLGRFDGMELGLRLGSNYKLNLVAGLPVDTTSNTSLDNSRKFHGLNLETGPWADYWHVNGYYIEQQAEGLLDRQAVGTELRYLHPDINIYTLLDYDIAYGELNVFSSQGSYTASNNDSYLFMIDYRNAPPLSARNALIGQTAITLTELRKTYSEKQINDLAKDRTARSTLMMLGYSHPQGDNYRWNIDISASQIGATPASGNVAATEAGGTDYYLSTQFTAQNLFQKRDAHIIGLAVNDSDSQTTTSVLLNSRIPASVDWFLNPSLRIANTRYSNSDSQQTIVPGLRFEYRIGRYASLEFIGTYELIKQTLWYGTVNSKSYYLDLGYRLDF